MTIRRGGVVAVLALATLAPSVVAGAQAPPVQQRPNIVVIMTDDMDLAALETMPKTRDLIGAAGTTFTDAFVSDSLCCPSRATLLTGQYDHNHGVLHNSGDNGGYQALDHSNTLPVWLQGAGYATAHVGKYLNGIQGGQLPAGWTEWYTPTGTDTYTFFNYGVDVKDAQGRRRIDRYGTAPQDYKTDVDFGYATAFIRRRAPSQQPFYLQVDPLAPHDQDERDGRDPTVVPAPRHQGAFDDVPMPRPPSFDEADVRDKPQRIRDLPRFDATDVAEITADWRARRESLLAVDDGVERVVDELERAGELDNTLILFTSDHGFFHGEHRRPSGKTSPYEEAIRVPLLLRGPGVPAGATIGSRVFNTDLAPTFVDVARATAGRTMDGRSIMPLLADPAIWTTNRDLLVQGYSSAGTTPGYQGVRSQHWLYVEYRYGERELYDLRSDPYQLRSLHDAPAHRQQLLFMQDKLDRLSGCSGPTCQSRTIRP